MNEAIQNREGNILHKNVRKLLVHRNIEDIDKPTFNAFANVVVANFYVLGASVNDGIDSQEY